MVAPDLLAVLLALHLEPLALGVLHHEPRLRLVEVEDEPAVRPQVPAGVLEDLEVAFDLLDVRDGPERDRDQSEGLAHVEGAHVAGVQLGFQVAEVRARAPSLRSWRTRFPDFARSKAQSLHSGWPAGP